MILHLAAENKYNSIIKLPTWGATQGDHNVETTEKKKIKAPRNKILIEIGIVIVVLFAIFTIAIGNMVRMASFSTALSCNIDLFDDSLETISDVVSSYQSITWLMDYWSDNVDQLSKEGISTRKPENIDDLLATFSKDYPEELTDDEVTALSPEDQKRFAKWCYNDINELFRMIITEDENTHVIVTITPRGSTDPILLFTNLVDEEGYLFGTSESVSDIQEVKKNTEVVAKAQVWKWAFSTPSKVMYFATGIPFEAYKGTADVELLGGFSAESVYKQIVHVDHIRRDVIIMLIIVLILILVVLYLIVSRPLEEVKSCVIEYSGNKNTDQLTHKLSDIRSHNEIGAFANEFSSLAIEMDRYTKEVAELAGEKERVETELTVATNIQMQMLPHVFPESDKFSIFASSDPAKEVGGDFYDAYMLDDDHLVMTIADVSGKGVPAALFMAVSKTMLKIRTVAGGTPARILRDVNNWLCEGNDSCMFVTVWHGIYTISTGELICANAGHENPGIRSGNEPFKLIRREHGLPLGVMEGAEFEDETFKFSSGDAFFIYTDGVPEAHAADDTMYGEDGLEKALATVTKDDQPQDIMTRVRTSVDDFVKDAPQYDDLTMLCLTIK